MTWQSNPPAASPPDSGGPCRRPAATFRFHGELNGFLARERRHRDIAYRCARAATVKNAIEALGVPHTEVDVILVNGESADLARPVREGGRPAPAFPELRRLPAHLLGRLALGAHAGLLEEQGLSR